MKRFLTAAISTVAIATFASPALALSGRHADEFQDGLGNKLNERFEQEFREGLDNQLQGRHRDEFEAIAFCQNRASAFRKPDKVEGTMKPRFDPVSCCTISEQGIATRYIGPAEAILQELRVAGFEIDHWEVSPRISDDDQDNLLVRAVKRSPGLATAKGVSASRELAIPSLGDRLLHPRP